MRIGNFHSVIQAAAKSGVGQYVLALCGRSWRGPQRHEFTLFVLVEDLPLFEFARLFKGNEYWFLDGHDQAKAEFSCVYDSEGNLGKCGSVSERGKRGG
jgi:hypothetical protein